MQVQKISASDNVNRIIKKTAPSGRVTLCMGQRDFVDYFTHVEIIDGVVEVDKEKLRGVEVVMLTLTGIFRYGRDDAESLGMDFRKELFKCNQQIYPVVRKKKLNMTPFQERVITKLGQDRAFPFIVEIGYKYKLPRSAPASVSLQVEPGEPGKPCGVDYDLRCYVTDDVNQQVNPKDSVSMVIRKLTFAPPRISGEGAPSGETVKDFKGNGKVRLELSLAREVHYHGEAVDVNVSLQNSSNKTTRRIKLTIIQLAEITLHKRTSYRRSVAELESEEGFPLQPGQMSFCRSYQLIPTLNRSRDKIGLALDGKLKYEDTGLASSTIIHNFKERDDLGIIITYLVRAKVIFGIGTNDVTLEVPFILSHPSKYTSGGIPPKFLTGNEEEDEVRRKFSGEFESQERESLFHDFSKLCTVESSKSTTKF